MPSQSRTFKTKHEVTIKGFQGGGAIPYPEFTVPAGLRCKQVINGGGRHSFYLDEFPKDLFPGNSCLRHDATHYGMTIPVDAVEETTPPPVDWPSSKAVSPETVVNALAVAVQETEVPYAMKRVKGVYVFLQLKPGMLGFKVTRRAGEVLEAKEEVVYDGYNADDAVLAYEEAAK